MAHYMLRVVVGIALAAAGGTASANGVGENVGWQFQTSADKVNRAYLEEMRQRRKAGPANYNYNTYIDRQFNCNVNASSLGNQGTNTTLASATSNPTVAGSGSANDSLTDLGGDATGTANATVGQESSGEITTNVEGTVTTNPSNQSTQALNSDQSNSGTQSASVSSSSGCTFAAGN